MNEFLERYYTVQPIEPDENYFYACEYMALTEIYARSLTTKRCEHDKTEAYIDDTKWHRKFLNEYDRSIKHKYIEIWPEIREVIKKHGNYTAQMWIDEYNRLKDCFERY